MITPMRKADIVVRREDAEDLLETLRGLGLVHLQSVDVKDRGVEEADGSLREAQGVVQRLEQLVPAETAGDRELAPELRVRDVLRIESAIKRLADLDQTLAREARAWEPFGAIDGRTLDALRRGGLHVGFFRVSEKEMPTLPNVGSWLPGRDGFAVLVSETDETPARAKKMVLPVRTPLLLAARRQRLARLRELREEALRQHAVHLPELRLYLARISGELDFLRARAGMGEADGLAWITGFAPVAEEARVRGAVLSAAAALRLGDPGPDDPAPTRLEHGPLVRIVQPVFTFLGVTPGYREPDVAWSFLLFLAIFSAMIIGDAGYGALLLCGVFALTRRKPALRGKFASLLMLMGGATVAWGLLSGNVFGTNPLPRLQVPALADPPSLMGLCFILGAIHLTVAHLWGLWRARRSWQALAQLGWIGSTWCMYSITGMMVLNTELPAWVSPVFIASALLIVLFMTPPKKIKEEWVQHMMLPLSFVNNFVDVVSYVRLYAVGMAGLALAQSFNEMILADSDGRGWVASGIMLLVLALMHGLNFILAGLGVMVHGIRLNTLEFASHIGLTWSGIPYKPFSRPQTSPNP